MHPSGVHLLRLDLAPYAGPAPAIRRERLVKGMDVKNVSHRFESAVPRRRVGVRTAADRARLGAALGEVLSARQGGSASS
ncbi:MAG: hypothetical protein Q8L86_08205 [Vicinamibacterales bacterium]|nr:hypothetical protein [Vicinamibacterales bacterium]